MKKVALVMGSASDLPIAEKAAAQLRALEIPFAVRVLSAHRTPEEAVAFARSARGEGFGVLIAFAGMSAALSGALAAQTTLPVIGVPCKGASLEGIDALLSTAMMPPGIPVAAVGIDAGRNAALLAAQILALCDDALAARLTAVRESDRAAVLTKDKEIAARFDDGGK